MGFWFAFRRRFGGGGVSGWLLQVGTCGRGAGRTSPGSAVAHLVPQLSRAYEPAVTRASRRHRTPPPTHRNVGSWIANTILPILHVPFWRGERRQV
jgi:hypothetical protein